MILFLNEITEDLYPHIGRKARGLAILYQQYRYYIPASFVITNGVNLTTERAQKSILAAFDLFQVDSVAVRSSPVVEDEKIHSLPGKFITVLDTPRAKLLSTVQSLLTSSPVGYPMNMIVQPMIYGVFSGACYSWDPLKNDGQLLVEMVAGMGHEALENQLAPISINLNRANEDFKDQIQKIDNKLSFSKINNKELITTLLKELHRNSLELEVIFGSPVNIEWAWSQDKLFILKCQSMTIEKIATSNITGTKIKEDKLKLVVNSKLEKNSKGNFNYNWSTKHPLWMMEYDFNVKSSARNVADYPCFFNNIDKFLKRNNNTYKFFTRRNNSIGMSMRKIEKMMDHAEHCYGQQRDYFDYLAGCDFDNMKPKILLNHFEQALNFYANHIALYSATESEVLDFVCRPLLEKISHDELLLLFKPGEQDLLVQEKNDWQRVLTEPFSTNNILTHIRKYPFLTFRYHSIEQLIMSFSELYKQQQGMSNISPLVANTNEIESYKTKFLSQYPEFKSRVSLINRISTNRVKIMNGWVGIDYFLTPFFSCLAKKYNENIEDIIKSYRINDIKNLIIHGDKLNPYIKMQRCDAMVWLSINGLVSISQGITAKKIIYRLERKTQSVSALSGIVASKGNAKGKAVIINCNDIKNYQKVNEKFQTGDILVSDTIQPDMYDLIKRSAAVITNEGGLLSHAAIICREINIPCMVQVSGATRLINDGQIVELANGELKIVSGW